MLLIWAISSWTLLMLVMNLLMRDEALNFPCLINFAASAMTIQSGQMSRGSFDYLIRSYSASIAVAKESTSSSQGDHFIHLSGNLTE